MVRSMVSTGGLEMTPGILIFDEADLRLSQMRLMGLMPLYEVHILAGQLLLSFMRTELRMYGKVLP